MKTSNIINKNNNDDVGITVLLKLYLRNIQKFYTFKWIMKLLLSFKVQIPRILCDNTFL